MKWSAGQYLKFENERTRPALELLARVPLNTPQIIYDLGCGPGNSTELLVERYKSSKICGIDLDDDMLASARKRLPQITFTKANLAQWEPQEPADLLYSNAVFQWLPDHMPLLSRLMSHLTPGGVLAIQMPDNLDEPSHRLMEETAFEGPWRSAFEGKTVKRAALPKPQHYVDALDTQASQIDVWHTIYYHRLANAEAIKEWVKGTGLRPWLAHVDASERPAFEAIYTEKLEAAYTPLSTGEVLLPFPRLFIVAMRRS